MISDFEKEVTKKNYQEEILEKGKRPLRMPRNYDFSVRNVNWDNYRKDFLLRTDAVWEKSKLLDIFYTYYKVNHIHFISIFSPP